MEKYNYTIIESWWRHNGIWDREQASGFEFEYYDGQSEQDYLEYTDEWWDGLTDEEKLQVYNEFFEEQ